MNDTLSYSERMKALAKPKPKPVGMEIEEGEGEAEYQAFAFGRVGNKPQISVTFRLVNAKGYNFAYSHYYGIVDNHPNISFSIEFTRHVVMIEGRNLEMLHRFLCDHKVREVHQVDELEAKVLPEGVPVVTKMEVRVKTADEGG